ncbi:hypothetical protein [Sphingomonas desiccabilis]|uniref:Uncharacterized protein n=1 Tax=Sphingomonas desiccabilis TaxID=429134 RepID=A0A4Q2J1B1_9SPHN|nr:hypothetical protein [Sphingomonas desiccabilis]MBB3910866.1 hypothetical protein [Sphingomonas desiccabilis]RXZ35470.1 hypothetical protein EO081_07585 [Sphingomonas desiccabilis]
MSDTPTIECPDTRQAIEDLRGAVTELRCRSARLSQMDERQRGYQQERRAIGDLNARIRMRAEKLALTPETLLQLVLDDLNAKARRGRPTPTRVTPLTLKDDIARSLQRIEDARAAKQAAMAEEKAALEHHVTMIQRAKAYGLQGLAA